MIITVGELMMLPEFKNQDASLLKMKLDSLEVLIRDYTHNNFQNRNVRFYADCDGDNLIGNSPYLEVGDTIQISESVNNGIYVVEDIQGEVITVDDNLYPYTHNLITQVIYPKSIKSGVIDLMKWELNNREKVGLKSETISRHSVTYYDQDTNNQVMGYPVSLLGFLEPYKKARF